MNKNSWFNAILLGLIGLAQTPALGAALGPYAWILGAVGSAVNIYLHNQNPPPPAA